MLHDPFHVHDLIFGVLKHHSDQVVVLIMSVCFIAFVTRFTPLQNYTSTAAHDFLLIVDSSGHECLSLFGRLIV